MCQCDELIRRFLKPRVPIFIMVGVPGSGKSTYAEKIADEYCADIYSADSIREELYGDAAIQGNGKDVFRILYKRIQDDVALGRPVIIDNTNYSKNIRKKVMNDIRKKAMNSVYNYDVKFIAVVALTSMSDCKQRNISRERVVPEWVIDRMIKNYEEPTVEEGFSQIIYF